MKKKEILERIVLTLKVEQTKLSKSDGFMLQLYKNKISLPVWQDAFNKCAILYYEWNLDWLYEYVNDISYYRRRQLVNFLFFKQANLWYTKELEM